jgi:hypothetical protein
MVMKPFDLANEPCVGWRFAALAPPRAVLRGQLFAAWRRAGCVFRARSLLGSVSVLHITEPWLAVAPSS